MSDALDIEVYFNFRSPYCYLASKRLFRIFENYHARMVWKPLSGWDGRSPPEVAVKKLPIARQDVSRYCRLYGIPFTPPPKTTDPTRAGAGSLLAEEKGLLRPYIVEVMRAEWARGQDIGQLDVLLGVGESIGLDKDELAAACDDKQRQAQLAANWQEADSKDIIGVPTFLIGEEIFWGNDRIEFVEEYLREQGLARL